MSNINIFKNHKHFFNPFMPVGVKKWPGNFSDNFHKFIFWKIFEG